MLCILLQLILYRAYGCCLVACHFLSIRSDSANVRVKRLPNVIWIRFLCILFILMERVNEKNKVHVSFLLMFFGPIPLPHSASTQCNWSTRITIKMNQILSSEFVNIGRQIELIRLVFIFHIFLLAVNFPIAFFAFVDDVNVPWLKSAFFVALLPLKINSISFQMYINKWKNIPHFV